MAMVQEADVSGGMGGSQGDLSGEDNYGCDRRNVEELPEEASVIFFIRLGSTTT